MKAGAFSKANWGDYTMQAQRGGGTTVKQASVFLKRIKSLKDEQLDDIYNAANETDEHKKVDASAITDQNADGLRSGNKSADDDSELLDPLYDELT